MPYNTTPIRPRKEVTGTVQLPLSRVKKIIAVDPDINICSNNAAFAITLATEIFIQYLAEQGHNMAKLDRKPRRNVQYKDLSAAVNAKDNLQFLGDTIPKTQPYKDIKHKAAETRAKLQGAKPAGADPPADDDAPAAAAGQPNGKKQKSINGFGVHDVVKDEAQQLQEHQHAVPVSVPDDGDVHMTG
ncbi:hypothetical protein DHEL01_v204225 [Diaporthe helianthi]|uniref:Transcription factor CBF/NF-Y/archaeal histone domain-containing protein n=1 Tax=Diaporthe helianthi TaxID=158607 RepID=A0A2P5I4F9_DIAHE|nr:hypothetical protein DHEL01_v204225 [Diaporthe helianthi]